MHASRRLNRLHSGNSAKRAGLGEPCAIGAVALCVLASLACDGAIISAAGNRTSGQVNFALSQSDGGETYRFIGSFEVRNSLDQLIASIDAGQDGGASLVVDLPIGSDYTLSLVAASFDDVLRDDGSPPYCTYQGPGAGEFTACTLQDPGPFTVRADETTDVVIPVIAHFEETDVDVLFSAGDVQIDLDVLGGDGTCSGVFCAMDETCAEIDGNAPSCYDTCQADEDCPTTETEEFRCIPTTGSTAVALCVALPPRWLQIAAGDAHTCAVASDHQVFCWGTGTDGRLGNGGVAQTTSPVLVSGLVDAVQVTAGAAHSCAVKTDGTAWCWGNGLNGRLGDGLTISSSVPVQVSGLTSATSISAGNSHTCATTISGVAYCWGNGGSGRLGQGSTASSSVPVPVSNLTSVATVSAGNAHTCASTTAGSARCWGAGANGRLGNGGVANASVPVQVTGLATGVNSISAGTSHSCATVSSGIAYCWGNGTSGRLGDGTITTSNVPVQVINLPEALQISAGSAHSCAAAANGHGFCWGDGATGRLGNGGIVASSVPVEVSYLSLAEGISIGAAHSCAITHAGGAHCWGEGSNGRLGNTGAADFSIPTTVPPPF